MSKWSLENGRWGRVLNVPKEYTDINGKYTLLKLIGVDAVIFNANPDGKFYTEDCMVRSATTVLNFPDLELAVDQYETVYLGIAETGRKKHLMMNHIGVLKDYLEDKGYEAIDFDDNMGLGQFLATHKVGKYIVCCDTHAFPYIDGIIYDTSNGIEQIEYNLGHRIRLVYYEKATSVLVFNDRMWQHI